VIDLSVGRNANDLMVFVNRSFSSSRAWLEEEGCLSVRASTPPLPGQCAPSSAASIGTASRLRSKAGPARPGAAAYEMDHLDGKLFLDRVRGIKRDLIVKKIRKLSRAGKW
jgi:peptide deformylase